MQIVPSARLNHAPVLHAQEKNVSADMLEGKVGRIYMPKQDVAGMALHKMKVRASLLCWVCTSSCHERTLPWGGRCQFFGPAQGQVTGMASHKKGCACCPVTVFRAPSSPSRSTVCACDAPASM